MVFTQESRIELLILSKDFIGCRKGEPSGWSTAIPKRCQIWHFCTMPSQCPMFSQAQWCLSCGPVKSTPRKAPGLEEEGQLRRKSWHTLYIHSLETVPHRKALPPPWWQDVLLWKTNCVCVYTHAHTHRRKVRPNMWGHTVQAHTAQGPLWSDILFDIIL